MKLQKFKEKDNKRTSIIVFTTVCILLVSGVILYRTFAIFEIKTNQNIINGNVQGMGDLEFAFYKEVDGKETIVKEVPKKDEGYSLDTSSSYCVDLLNDKQVSTVNWDYDNWEVRVKNISTTKTKCYLYFKTIYQEEELNGAIPDLGNGRLIPITFNGTGGAVKANIMDKDNPWYSYANQKWANAVILKNGKADDYHPGDEIPEDNIESYFVWIPRYRYQIWNGVDKTSEYTGVTSLGTITDATTVDKLNQAKEIQIVFETKNDEVKKGVNTNDWLTHPAFLSFDSNGFWVGKFETSKSGSASNDSISPESVQIKPGVSSWRSIKVANAFYTAYNYKRELESHMMKNTEWGAVAYLTNSQYGRCDGNGDCTEVRINNNSGYITGSSAVNAPTCGYTRTNLSCNKYGTSNNTDVVNLYNNPYSVASSTTNNYYGVFDMAGGAWEYVMGVMVDTTGKPASGRHNVYNSGFVGTLTCPTCQDTGVSPDSTKTEWTTDDKDKGQAWPDSRYYDTYGYDTIDWHFQRGLLGDGTKEFGPFYQVAYKTGSGDSTMIRRVSEWNADVAFFVSHGSPWFIRGGGYDYGTDTGLATFNTTYGQATVGFSFRVVLTP